MTTQHEFQAAYLDAAKSFLAPQYRRLSDNQVAGLLLDAMEQMSPMEQDSFATLSMQYAGENFLRDIGRGISQVASRALPYITPIAQIAAPLVGTVIGGPVGGAVGGQLAGMLGQIASPSQRHSQPTAPPSRPASQAAPQPRPSIQTAPPANLNPAATQLMSLLSNPQLIQALLGQVMGNSGGGVARVTSNNQMQTIPFGAMMNAVSELAQRAAEESILTGNQESDNYLMDSWGDYTIGDPSNPEQRADAVMQLLRDDYEAYHEDIGTDNNNVWENNEDKVGQWLANAGLVR
jgi:hypothetical protein